MHSHARSYVPSRAQPRPQVNLGLTTLVAVDLLPAALAQPTRRASPWPQAMSYQGSLPEIKTSPPKPLVFPTLHLPYSKKLGRLVSKPPWKVFQKHRRISGTDLIRRGDISFAAGPFRSWLPRLA